MRQRIAVFGGVGGVAVLGFLLLWGGNSREAGFGDGENGGGGAKSNVVQVYGDRKNNL